MFYKNEVIVSELNESDLIDKIIGYLDRNPELGYINLENKTFKIYYQLDFGRYYGELGLDVKGEIETIDNTISLYLKYGELNEKDWFLLFVFTVQIILFIYFQIVGISFWGIENLNLNFVIPIGIFFMISNMYFSFSKQYNYLKILVKNLSSNNQ